jgi:predicted RNase H-like HicB family nuclease
MTKLIDILRNLLTAPKDVAEFELLAEQKINEIESILNEGEPSIYFKTYGKDNLDAAKKLAQDWITNWKETYEDEEPIAADLEKDNDKLYNYIQDYYIRKNLISWPELGFKKFGNKYFLEYGKDNLEAAKKLAQDWIETHKDEPTPNNLRISNFDLYYYIYTDFIKKNSISWPELGFKKGTKGNEYFLKYGKDLEAAKKLAQDWIANWKEKETNKDEEPISADLEKNNSSRLNA